MKTTISLLVLLAAVAGCGSQAVPVPPASPSSAVVTQPVPSGTEGSATVTAHPPAPGTLIAVSDEGRVTYTVTLRSGQCHARDGGRLPDPSCTLGSIDPAVTQASIGRTICVRGWTATVRPPVSETDHAKYGVAEPAYGITAPGELDHLVPLELGGANDITNLWPEAGVIPNPKDAVENELRAAVCAGQVTLRAAQLAVARDWETAGRLVPASAPPSRAAAAAFPSHVRVAPSPVHSARSAPPASCYPKTSGGNCYEPGEFCSKAEHGMSGVAGVGKAISCRQEGSRWRWA